MMKSTVRTIILVAASVFAAVSCQKEAAVSETQNSVNAGETIQVNINASLGDLVAADGTKATAESVVRLKWTAGDKVQAYCGANKIGTDLTVTPSANGLFASLTGTITPPEPGEIITFVYSSGCTADGLTFDFSSQDAEIPFVAYATLVYDGTATLTGKMVEFKFATSVMKIAATNLGGGAISNATISGINTKVKLEPSDDSETCTIAGENKATITKTAGIEASSDGTRAIITVGLVPDNNTGRNITVTQTDYTNKGVITPNEIQSNKSYTTPTSLFTCGTLGTGTDAHDYVLIAGTKWATMNIGATASEGENSYGKYFAWGDIVGQTWDGSSWSDGGFSTAPDIGSNPKMLPLEKDAANVNWGDPWRMPTLAEFKALKDATYWSWDSTDKGYYVYAPQGGDEGGRNGKKSDGETDVSGTYTKSSALLFFPAAGDGNGANLNYKGYGGYCWSSSINNTDHAYYLYFHNGDVNPEYYGYRSLGLSVRPVSD